MPNNRARLRKARPSSIRQSVTIPGELAVEVRRIAKQNHLTMSRALVTLAEKGVRAERDAKQELRAAYRRFINESEPKRKSDAGTDLIRTIFGTDALAEDSLL